jgi:hypothetical protein
MPTLFAIGLGRACFIRPISANHIFTIQNDMSNFDQICDRFSSALVLDGCSSQGIYVPNKVGQGCVSWYPTFLKKENL